ncbi:MAG: iron-containing alcohol dehydrogenase [Synergistaceae bacterium]|nr:iron-containing alcohol dehydrogenase [Synergistaceae bacterium]
MENFVFGYCTKILFGRGMEDKVGAETKRHGKKVLLVYGGGSIKKSGLFDKVVKSLTNAGVEFVEFGGAQPNPRLSLVREGIKSGRGQKIDFILAVGGGSAIDTAKAIALGIPYEGDVWDFFAGKQKPQSAIKVGVILTIPAAGSESSMFSVITNETELLKCGYGNDLIRPVFAIMNPELTYTLPPYQTACGCVDIMMHTLERYFTNVTDVELTDRLCEGLLKTMVDKSGRVFENPDDYRLRAEIMWAGSISHNNLMETGRIGDFSSHDIEHEMGAIYDIAHGAGLAIVFPAWCKYVFRHNLKRFVQFAVRVMNVEQDFENPERTALEGIDRIEKLFVKMGMPVRLSQVNIGDDRWDEMASKCTKGDTKKTGNFLPLAKRDILNIFELCR